MYSKTFTSYIDLELIKVIDVETKTENIGDIIRSIYEHQLWTGNLWES